MMKGALLLALRINAGSDGFENEEAVLASKTGVLHSAFDIGEALVDQRCFHLFARYLREAESFELIYLVA